MSCGDKMKIVHIKQKLQDLGVNIEDICLGDFDVIGEYCAKRTRSPGDPLYKSCGALYRSNYERGLLSYYLIKQYGFTSFLEVGTGRGYVTFCVAKAFYDMGVKGKILTMDIAADEKFFGQLQNVFPKEWFDNITFVKGPSQAVLAQLNEKGEKFDFAYIDADHSFEGTKADWEGVKGLYTKACLFDDYHLPSKDDPGIKCRDLIDTINCEKEDCNEIELIKLDRRIFIDERGYTDEQINYGQCLMIKKSLVRDTCDW
jgi:predicted O-methyltransferase YrrM